MAGDTDPGNRRKRALDEFVNQRADEGYSIETHEATHAIIVTPGGLLRRLVGRRRYVVEVDDHGRVSMRPAERLRH